MSTSRDGWELWFTVVAVFTSVHFSRTQIPGILNNWKCSLNAEKSWTSNFEEGHSIKNISPR